MCCVKKTYKSKDDDDIHKIEVDEDDEEVGRIVSLGFEEIIFYILSHIRPLFIPSCFIFFGWIFFVIMT